ncbi:WD40/YVTN/BNR-like repeat-containing protein [Gordoniibacillus kamchatkensis]|uniref:WD40/YVTN/BNR-like repeat-containing protein n=1 Tax=Gordoniibacillus kamchatkensis TaxID=1590651 RepID=UPI001E2A1CAB|nr:hypothetical protein [Paenibacillus sp. VKM B-2647]
MNQLGIYYSKDEGKLWTSSRADGLQGQMTALAVHPDEESILAVGTTAGIYLSKDYGQTFTALVPNRPVSAILFMNAGDVLIAGSGSDVSLAKINRQNNVPEMIKTLTKDEITYIAQNPRNPTEAGYRNGTKGCLSLHE